jgi:hypothetical protein
VALIAAFFFWVREIVAGDPVFTERLFWMATYLLANFVLVQLSGRLSQWLFKGYRIGASSGGLDYQLGRVHAPIRGSRERHAPWREVYFDGQRLLVGRRILPIAVGRLWMFDEERVRTLVLVNIPRANLLTSGQLMRKQAGPLLWILLALILVLLVPILILL